MKALVYHGKEDLRLEERPIASIAPGEMLLRELRAGICGTDLRILHGAHRHYPPGVVRIPGHEVVGEIAALGGGVLGWQVGQRVFVAPNTGCGRCLYPLEQFAEAFAAAQQRSALKIVFDLTQT